MRFEVTTLDCQCPRCGHLTAMWVPEAAVSLPLHDRCMNCDGPFAVTTFAIGIHQDTASPEPSLSVKTTTAPA